jgi:hypothetical protein
MQNSTIQQLARHDSVVKAKFFSQQWFRRKNGLDSKLGLCSALVQLWWASVREGEDGIELLKNASPSLVEEIVNRQLRSYYFGKTPTEDTLDEETVYWLGAKYGRTDLQEIRRLCETYGADDLLELDLILAHQAIIVAKQSFSSVTPDFLDAFALTPGPGLRLLLLRHVDPRRRGGQAGHRLAMAVDSEGGCKFFEPNRGEMTFNTLLDFRAWFAGFWQVCEHKPKIEQPVADVPPLRLYRFGSALATTDLLIPSNSSSKEYSGNACRSSGKKV